MCIGGEGLDILYQTFVDVVREQTLSRAAEKLHTTQPTVTRQIQQLERLLGVALFERIGKRLVVTDAGRRVYDYAVELASLESRMLEDLNAFVDPESGIIRIGSGLSPALYRLPAILSSYALLYPRVRFQVVTGSSKDTIQRLDERAIDIAIVTTPPHDDGPLDCLPLWHDQLVVVAPKAHALSGAACSVAQLVHQPMVVMHADSGLRHLVHETFLQAGVDESIRPLVETDSLEAMSRFVQAGLGLAIMPWSAVQDDVREARLGMVRLTDIQLGSRTITAVSRHKGVLAAAAAAFLRVLPDLVQQTAPGDLR